MSLIAGGVILNVINGVGNAIAGWAQNNRNNAEAQKEANRLTDMINKMKAMNLEEEKNQAAILKEIQDIAETAKLGVSEEINKALEKTQRAIAKQATEELQRVRQTGVQRGLGGSEALEATTRKGAESSYKTTKEAGESAQEQISRSLRDIDLNTRQQLLSAKERFANIKNQNLQNILSLEASRNAALDAKKSYGFFDLFGDISKPLANIIGMQFTPESDVQDSTNVNPASGSQDYAAWAAAQAETAKNAAIDEALASRIGGANVNKVDWSKATPLIQGASGKAQAEVNNPSRPERKPFDWSVR